MRPCGHLRRFDLPSWSSKRSAVVFMNRLPLIVVLRMREAIWTRKRLRSLIGFKSQITLLERGRLLVIAEPAIAEHQVVVCLQILGIDGDRLLQLVNRLPIFVLQEEDATDVVDHYAILWILLRGKSQVLQGFVVASFIPKRTRVEVM